MCSLEHIELPVHIVGTPQATLSSNCVSALTHLPEILLEEEMESYTASQKHCTDLLSSVHNTGGMAMYITKPSMAVHLACASIWSIQLKFVFFFLPCSVHAESKPHTSSDGSTSVASS